MCRFIAVACVLWFSITAIRAQSITGQIIDGETGQPLPGATVLLPTLDLGTTTNASGSYTLALSSQGTYRIVFSFVGYKTETRSVTFHDDEFETLNIVLTPSFVEVGDVTVSAKARSSDILSTPQSIAVVDSDALARSAGATPMDALDGVAGVRLLRTGPGVAKPVIRGLTSQRVLIVTDGVRQEGQGWGDEHGPEIGGADVDRIEIVRGPSSLLYGSDALGGVVHTRHDDLLSAGNSLSGSINLTGVSVTRLGSGAATLGGRSGPWGYEGRVGILRAGHVQTPTSLILNTAQEQRTSSVRLGRQLGLNGYVIVDASTFRSKLGLFEPDFLGEEGDSLNLGRYDFIEPFQEIAHNRAGLQARVPFGQNRLELVTAVQQNQRREFGHHDEGDGQMIGEGPALHLQLSTATADARIHHRPIGRVFGTVGASGLWQKNETLAEETLIPGATTLNGAVYITEELVLPTVTLDAGVRFDARSLNNEASEELGLSVSSRRYTAITGALGAAWQPRGDLSIAANLGRAFRAPQLIELFGNGVHEGTLRFERGNASLSPETSVAFDGVMRYLTPHMYAEVSGFINRISDYIFPRATSEIDAGSGLVVYEYGQANARLVGGEFRLDIHPHVFHGLGLHVSGDVTRGMNRETNTALPFVPPARIQLAAEYKTETVGQVDKLEVRFGPTFTASQNRPELPEEIPTNAFSVWAFSLSSSFSSNGLMVSPTFTIDNLFNSSYVDPMSRFRPYGVLTQGRSIRIGVRVDLGV